MCTERCSAFRHWHTQVRRLVTLAAWGIALARCVPERIQYKVGLTLTVHRCLQYRAPVYGRLLYTPVSDSQPTSFTISHSTLADRTTLLAQHFRSSCLLCRRSDGLELATGQSLWPGAQQRQFQTIAEYESISSLPLNIHSAVLCACLSVTFVNSVKTNK